MHTTLTTSFETHFLYIPLTYPHIEKWCFSIVSYPLVTGRATKSVKFVGISKRVNVQQQNQNICIQIYHKFQLGPSVINKNENQKYN